MAYQNFQNSMSFLIIPLELECQDVTIVLIESRFVRARLGATRGHSGREGIGTRISPIILDICRPHRKEWTANTFIRLATPKISHFCTNLYDILQSV